MKITLSVHWSFFSSLIYRIFLAAHLRVRGKAQYVTMVINMCPGRILWRRKKEIEIASYCGQCKSLPHASQMKWLTNVRDFYEINIWWPKTVNNLRNIKDHYTAHKKFSSTKIELCYFEKWSVYFVLSDLSWIYFWILLLTHKALTAKLESIQDSENYLDIRL